MGRLLVSSLSPLAGHAHPPLPNPWQVCMRKQGALRKDLAERPEPDGATGAEAWHDYFAALERSLGHEFVKRGCFSSWHGGRSLSCCIIDLAHISHAAPVPSSRCLLPLPQWAAGRFIPCHALPPSLPSPPRHQKRVLGLLSLSLSFHSHSTRKG